MRDRRQARFRIAHGGGTVSIAGTEIAMPVDEWIAHGKILCHADQCIVNGLVSMRVQLAEYVADDGGRFAGFGVRSES